jgi:hypothetical protein
MQRIFTAVSLLVLVAASLAACGPVTAIPTVTIVPTNITVPTSTDLPEPSATATLLQLEKDFIIPTRQSELVNTPTPIATPDAASTEVRLRDLSEQDFIELIFEMNRYSYENHAAHGDWWTDGQFISSQEPVALAIQEYLYRFPESPHAERLRWQLAFIHSIGYPYDPLPGNNYDAEWLVGKLQDALDQGTASPDRLENVLDKFWFDVTYVQPIENLFADGTTGILYAIAPQVWAEDEENLKSPDFFQYGALFIVVRELEAAKFQIIPLKNAWNFSFSESWIHEISDHNQNGVPEVALYIGAHSGTMCGGNLLIYEWNTDTFVELTWGNISRGDCGETIEYTEIDGAPTVVRYAYMPARIEQYIWDGEYYTFAGYESDSLINRWWSTGGSFREESEAIEALLAVEDAAKLSPAHIDFLRYRLGIVHALSSKPVQSKNVLQDLVNDPRDETRTIYSDLAGNFLQYYSDDKTLLLACKHSREMLDSVNDPSQNEEELLGIPFDFVFGSGLLRCFDQDVLELLITKIPVTVEDVPAELRKYGIDLQIAEERDIDLDGILDEWLIAFDNIVYVLAPTGDHYESVILGDFWYDEDAYQYASVEIDIERWVGIDDPILTIRTDQELSIHRIGNDYHSTELNFEFDVKDVIFSSQNTPPEYQVFTRKPGPDEEFYGVPWSGYRWDPVHQEFRGDLIEYTLFIEHNPEKAFEIAEGVAPLLMDWREVESVEYWLPRYFYLCGLSYELSGDAQKAAEMYWQIWHDFPGSHYALMARYKLETANP